MTLFSLVPWAAAVFSLITAYVSLLPKRPSPAKWYFFAGMAALGALLGYRTLFRKPAR